MAKRVIVIGSGAAGMKAASAARSAGDADITVFTEEEHVSYSPCAIPFVIEGKIKDFDSIVMHTPEFYAKERNIKVLTRTKVTGVDMDKKTVTSADGSVHPYDSLVLSVGGSVFMPPVEGVKLPGVFPVRNIADGMAIKKALDA